MRYKPSRHVRISRRLSVLLAFAALAALPNLLRAQHVSRSAIGAPAAPMGALLGARLDVPGGAWTRLSSHATPQPLAPIPELAARDSTRRSVLPFLIGGAAVGALIGYRLMASFDDVDCSEFEPFAKCSPPNPATGAAVGAAVGALGGWALWALTTSAARAQPGSRP